MARGLALQTLQWLSLRTAIGTAAKQTGRTNTISISSSVSLGSLTHCTGLLSWPSLESPCRALQLRSLQAHTKAPAVFPGSVGASNLAEQPFAPRFASLRTLARPNFIRSLISWLPFVMLAAFLHEGAEENLDTSLSPSFFKRPFWASHSFLQPVVLFLVDTLAYTTPLRNTHTTLGCTRR